MFTTTDFPADTTIFNPLKIAQKLQNHLATINNLSIHFSAVIVKNPEFVAEADVVTVLTGTNTSKLVPLSQMTTNESTESDGTKVQVVAYFTPPVIP